MSQYRRVGKVKDAHGLKGDLYILVFSGDTSWDEDLTSFGLGTSEDDIQVYEVEKVKPYKDGLMLKPKNINNRNQSDELKGKLFFINEELLVSDEGETIYLTEIEGFEVFDGKEKVGVITGFSSNGFQDLLVIERTKDNKPAEIPFVEDFVDEIDYDTKQVFMNLPEGLLELDASLKKEDKKG